MLRRIPLLAVALIAPALGAAGCGQGAPGQDPSGGRVLVVATTTQTEDLVRHVGGHRVQVEGLLGPEVDPHDYEPRPSDARAVSGARAIFRSGGELDAWLSEVTASAGGDVPVIELIDRVKTIEGGHEEAHGDEAHGGEAHGEDDDHGGAQGAAFDPHWWHDPRNAARAVRAIEAELARIDPAGREQYERNARAYLDRLRRLDRQVARCLARVPDERRKLVTTHDALGYFARRYDIEVVGSVLDSLSTEAQPSAGDTQALIEQIREEDVRAVFAESSVDSRLEAAIARETRATVGPPLYVDTLGPRGSPGATYVGSVAANADAMARGFTGGDVRCPSAAPD